MLCDHNTGQSHLRSAGKKGKKRNLELRNIFRSDFRKERKKMILKHFLKHQNRSKSKIRKITVKSRNEVKSAVFGHVLCHISAIFEDVDLTFCTHIHETYPSNILYVFL